MVKLPSIKKFRGDNTQSFSKWILMFEAECRALEISQAEHRKKWRNALLVSMENDAFIFTSLEISHNNPNYDALVITLKDKYGGELYKRHIQTKLRSHKFTSDSNVSEYLHELKGMITELYGVEDTTAINQIATSHILSGLDDSLKNEVQILQLAGNSSPENLLELISSKLTNSFVKTSQSAMSMKNPDERLDRLENIVMELANQVKETKIRGKPTCEVCHKEGHVQSKCFKTKTCFKCSKKGHIAKFCRAPSQGKTFDSSAGSVNAGSTLPPANRLTIKAAISGAEYDFLYDPGSQYTMIPKQIYDNLKHKPQLIQIEKSGIGVDGHHFRIEGVIYLNLQLKQENGSFHTIEYEPVLVSSCISTPIFGINTENRFSQCTRRDADNTLTYTVSSGEQVKLKFFRESNELSSAYVRVSKSAIIPKRSIGMIKTKVNLDELKGSPPYCLVNYESSSLEIPEIAFNEVKKHIVIEVQNNSEESYKVNKGDYVGKIENIIEEFKTAGVQSCSFKCDKNEVNTGDISKEEENILNNILTSYQSVIPANDKPAEVPIQHKIRLKDDIPVSSNPRRIPYAYREEVNKQIDDLLKKGYIEPSFSEYGAPLVPVIKRDGTIRICCDFRKLNEKTIPAKYPIPHTDDVFNSLTGSKVFSVIDLKSAYHQILIDENDREKTACVNENFKFHWVRMPFGLNGAPYTLASAVSFLLKDCKDFSKGYYDDILIHSSNKETHFQHLKTVFEVLAKHGVKVNFKKCYFVKESVEFLGHVVDERGLHPLEKNIADIIGFEVPRNVDDVRRFLGMAGFYKRFVPKFAEKAQPLFDLLKKGKTFLWEKEVASSFELLKDGIRNNSKLVRPDVSKSFVLHVDASKKAVGFALFQEDGEGLVPVSYGGRVLSEQERRYATIDKELLAVYYGVKRNELYLKGKPIIVYSDHKPLLSLKSFKDIVNKRFNWILYLEELNVKIRYIEGKENCFADYLSRHPKFTEQNINITSFASTSIIDHIYENEDIIEQQHNDETLSKVFQHLNGNEELPAEFRAHQQKLYIENNILKYKHHQKILVVAPSVIRKQILSLCHNHFTGGHFGIFKTHNKVLESFWWPSLYRDVQEYISQCEICLLVKLPNRKHGNVGKRSWPSKPLELISIDYLTELPTSSKNNTHLLVINDHFSKYIQVYPLPNRTAKTASIHIVDYFLRFGVPMKLYSDRDPSFEAELFQHVMNAMGVKKLRTTGYNPQANGLTEQSNLSCKNYLTSYVDTNRRNWDLYCRELAFAYNTSVHSSTGFTPAELFFGRKFNVPMDIMFGIVCDDEPVSCIDEFKKRIAQLYELARRSMNTKQEIAATYYDKKVRDDPLQENDRVYVLLPRNRYVKLALKWAGPYPVTNCAHPSYEVEVETFEGIKRAWFTRNKLKRAPSPSV